MSRWKLFERQYLRWSSTVTQVLVLSVLTFCVLLPFCCHRLLYSYFFNRSLYLDSLSEQVLQDSYEKGQEALRHWQSHSTAASAFSNITRGPKLLVTVVTARRTEGREFHYLLQVMQRLASLLTGCGEQRCAEVLVCDVESGPLENEDALLLEGKFWVVRQSSVDWQRVETHVNTFEKEKRDYVYCLKKGWELARPQNVVVLEDDALPREDFFTVVQNLLSRKFVLHTLYVKLYHPERLQRYWNPEPYRILEWVGLGVVGATVLLLALSRWNPLALSFTLSPTHLLFCSLYVMVVVELVGRHYLLEARRISPQLYAISPATECCTPAMLFPGSSSLRVVDYLEGSFCSSGNAKDTVLYRMVQSVPGERAHSLEPNLVSHIGAFSSVRPNPARPKLL